MINVRMLRVLVVAGLTAVSAAAMPGCTKAPAGPSDFAEFSQTDLRVGTGPAAIAGDVLAVHYTGWLYDGSGQDGKGAQFDSSVGLSPFQFFLGRGQVIQGWDQGLVGMQVGGLRRLVIPPSLAYGSTRNRVIPPNATLVFEVELVRIGLEATP